MKEPMVAMRVVLASPGQDAVKGNVLPCPRSCGSCVTQAGAWDVGTALSAVSYPSLADSLLHLTE